MRPLQVLSLALALVSGHAAAQVVAGEVPTAEARERDISVGDQLQATQDVELDEATIAAGSKVSVSARKQASGRILLDVALADGHIVRNVPLTSIVRSFRRVEG